MLGAILFSAGFCIASLPSTVETEPIPDTDALANTVVAQAALLVKATVTIQIPSAVSSQSETSEELPHECLVAKETEQALVVAVIDGDTIHVEMNGTIFPLRYIGMDAPDTDSEHPSTSANAALVENKTITLVKDASNTDPFGRLLRYVITENTFVNAELVRQGHAISASYPPDTACDNAILAAEQVAREALMGLWSPSPPITGPGSLLVIVEVNKRLEFVDIENQGTLPQSLVGWYLVSERGNQTCWLSGVIEPDEVLRIWAGSNETGFSCGFGTQIWNNSASDPAVLYDSTGQQISRFP